MTFGSLFAGVGGFDLGLERAGMRCAWQVELDPRCRDVLARHWPDVRKESDVRTVDPADLAGVDLVCGGFPCQDVSVAGRRAGLSGSRSGLWWELHRVLAGARPRWCLIENVPGLLSSGPCDDARRPLAPGLDLATILDALVELGYGVSWRVLDAQFAGLAQRRARVFLVGHLGDGRAAPVLLEPESVRWADPPRRRARREAAPADARDRAGRGVTVRDPGGSGLAEVSGTLVAREGPHGAAGLRWDDTLVASTLAGGGRSRSGYSLNDVPAVAATLRGGGRELGAGSSAGNTPLVPDVAWALQERDGKGPDSSTKPGHLIPAVVPDPRRHDGTHRGRLRGIPELNASNNDLLLVADPLIPGEGKTWTHEGTGNFRTRNVLADGLGLRRLTPRECERLQGFPDDWTAGHSDSVRYRMLGNAVPVPVAAAIGQRVVTQDNPEAT